MTEYYKNVTGYRVKMKDNKYFLGEKTTKQVAIDPVGIGVYATCVVDDHWGMYRYTDEFFIDENFVDVNINNLEQVISCASTIVDVHNTFFFFQENDIFLEAELINHDEYSGYKFII